MAVDIVGVDAEKICPYDEELARQCFLPEEINAINQSGDLFYTYTWRILILTGEFYLQ